MKFKRKQLVLASMVLALGAAVYLTWQLGGDNILPVDGKADDTTSRLGAAQLVNNVYQETVSDDLTQPQTATASTTIAQARVSRENSRDSAMEIIDKVLVDADADGEAKETATVQASAIAQNIMEETNVESLLIAKGYTDCIAYINNGECNVVVSTEITETDTIVIQEVVMTQTGLSADKINIIGTK
ncbi:SpoIIIAH-like family protein [Scatolibacter rhodanostii]|uniref:SpoIIIAH-like family protein n=1 Tax=Scatolibacter rhodanostii TaxID=2014781 RepID=UPI000C0756A8|nr:SpoIIIAH-like family protein [Scatolibacter rhodanostii]